MAMFRALALIAVLFVATPAPGHAMTANEVLTRAGLAVDNFLIALSPTDVARIYVQNAYAVMIVPDLIKGGFIVGAEHGLAAFFVRDTVSGRFGPPVFFEIFGGSLGLQAGAKSSDVIITVMNPDAVEAILDGDVQLGAELSLAVMRVGGTFGAATTSSFGEDLYVFERTAGLFGGVSLSGSGLVPQNVLNTDYWGENPELPTIVRSFDTVDQRSSPIREALLRF